MSKTEKAIVRWLAALSAAVGAVSTSLAAYPGDVVDHGVIIVLGAVAAGLAALVPLLVHDG